MSELSVIDERITGEGPSRKQREFMRREQDIIHAALTLFEGNDWELVTVEQIAKKAEIGKGTVYKHFTCKEDIYANISIAFNQQLLDTFLEIDLTESTDLVMRKVIKCSFDLYLTNPAKARISHYCKRGDFVERLTSCLQNQFNELEKNFEQFIFEVLDKGMEQGMVPNRPHEQLIVGLEATFDGALSMIWNGHCNQLSEMAQNEFIDVISEYMLAGLLGLQNR